MTILVLSSVEIFTARWTDAYIKRGYKAHLVIQEPVYEDINSNVIIHQLPFKRPYGAFLKYFHLKCIY